MILRYLIKLINNLMHSDQKACLPGRGMLLPGLQFQDERLDSTVPTISGLKGIAPFPTHILRFSSSGSHVSFSLLFQSSSISILKAAQ